MRLMAYAGVSTALAFGVLARALHERPNFYSACVYISQSNACIMILANLILLNLGAFLVGLQKLLFGQLRAIELEQLYEKAWFAITETCLAMTIFRDEVGAFFVIMFVALLVGKVWAWIVEGRVEVLEQQPPANPRLFHTRLSISLLLSGLFDYYMLTYATETVRRQDNPSMMVMFAFEFAVLTTTTLSTCCRYAISLWEARVMQSQLDARIKEHDAAVTAQEARRRAAETKGDETAPFEEEPIEDLDEDVPGWEDKGRWIFGLELLTDFFKLVLYLTFFCVLCMFYGMPIHIIRDVALTIRSFYKRINDFIKYRQATHDMHQRYPDATAEEIQQADVCIICRGSMQSWQPDPAPGTRPPNEQRDERYRPKRLPCGHILHFMCLRSWLERQQNCPTCRQPVLSAPTTAHQARSPDAPPPGQNAPPGAAAAPRRRRHEGGRNRIRYLNLGPLRLGFGVGPDLPHLAQQMQQGPQQPANTQAQTAAIAGNSSATRAQTDPTTDPGAVQAQISALERQMLLEASRLRLQNEQLTLLRALQAELNRLRGVESQVSSPASAVPIQPHHASFSPLFHPPGPASMQAFTLHSAATSLPNPSIPGLTLPEGWTMVPLQRVPVPSFPPQMPPQAMNMRTPMTNGQGPQARHSTTGSSHPHIPPGAVPNATAPIAASVAPTPTNVQANAASERPPPAHHNLQQTPSWSFSGSPSASRMGDGARQNKESISSNTGEEGVSSHRPEEAKPDVASGSNESGDKGKGKAPTVEAVDDVD